MWIDVGSVAGAEVVAAADADAAAAVDDCVVVVGLGRERRPQATAWLAPLPPAWMLKEVEVRVSPGDGKRGVTETMSTFREPMMRIAGAIFLGFHWMEDMIYH